jgi:hypothetical protein
MRFSSDFSLLKGLVILHLDWQFFNFDYESDNAQMPSIIEGYNYDIFSGCCQKYNRHNELVTEFVDKLEGEL